MNSPANNSSEPKIKRFIAFTITLVLAVAFLQIAGSSLTAKTAHDPSTGHVSRLTPSQEDALKVLALDGETNKRIVDRADPPKVTRFMEIHELFKEMDSGSTVTIDEETLDRATAYVPCEIAWHLRIIDFDETVQCLERSASWKATSKVGDLILVNFFADTHAFELIQLLKTTDVGDEELFLTIQKMLSSEGLFLSISPASFLRHALILYKQDSTSLERRQMVKSLLSLHLSAVATERDDRQMIKALYTELAQDVPTLLYGGSPTHAIAVVVTRVEKDKYDIVIVNSGDGLENHAINTKMKPKGFHTGASYDSVSADPGKSIEATSYNPLLRMKGVSGAQLASAHYHYGTMEQVYYVAKNEKSLVVEERHPMSWEWAEEQGIGSCAASSIWLALHFYYQALGYANDIRLSILGQAIDDLGELQDTVKDFERKVNASYRKPRKGEISHPLYNRDRVKDLALAKDKAEKGLHLRRTIILMALNEILRNLIVWHHELGDINADLFTTGKESAKMEQRRSVLEKAIPQTMASFHDFWALQEEKYLKRKQGVVDAEAELSSVLDSWQSIRADVRTIYNDAIRVTGIKPGFATALAKPPSVKRTFKPINVTSLKEHASLRRILRYITNFGDSPALRVAVSRHLKAHTENANAAKYLVVMYACLTRNVSLLDHLVVEKELPLLYTIDTAKKNPDVSMYWDLATDDSIAALAAHEFVQHGQPLDAFPELLRRPQKETRRIVSKFKDEYKEIAPVITAEAPSQDDVDEAFQALVESDIVPAIAYILPKASRKAISAAFLESKSVRVLRLLIDLAQDPKLLEQKMKKSIKEDSVEVVELVLPVYLRYEKHVIEKDLIEKQRLELAVTGEPAKASPLDHLLNVAYAENAIKVVELLAPFANRNAIVNRLSAAAKDGSSEIARVLARYVADNVLFAAIERASTRNHRDLAKALFDDYARKKPTEAVFLKAAEQGNLDDLERLMPSVDADTIGYALLKAAQKGEMVCFARLAPHATEKAISDALFKV